MTDHLWQISVKVPAEMEEIAVSHFADVAPAGFEQKAAEDSDITFVIYLSDDDDRRENISRLARVISLLGIAETSMDMRRICREDWVNKVREEMRPIEVGDLRIIPPWFADKCVPRCKDIIVSPGFAFGTGYHQSTRLALRLLADAIKYFEPEMILDVGCGSGILSIASVVLGVKRTYACDISEQAVESAKANARSNSVVEEIAFKACDVSEVLDSEWPRNYSLVVANLTSEVFKSRFDALSSLTCPGGTLILSGIYDQELGEIQGMFSEGWEEIDCLSEDKWFGLMFKKDC